MVNKNLLIALGVSLLILVGAIIYRVSTEEDEGFTPSTGEQEIQHEETEDTSLGLGKNEEIKTSYQKIEDVFLNLLNKLLSMEDDIIEKTQDDIFQLQERIESVGREIEKEELDSEKINNELDLIEERIEEITKKILELKVEQGEKDDSQED